MEYTLETLIEVNTGYHHQHRVTASDVEKANRVKQAIEASRSDTTPKAGDIVQLTTKHGDYYAKVHIEGTNEDGKLSVCERPYVPFVIVDGQTVNTSTSGGAWCAIPAKLERVGVAQKAFHDWGHVGACANGAITIMAQVNVWRYTDGNPEFTTETHDRFYAYFHDEPVGCGYLVTVLLDGCAHTAFHTQAEYLRWVEESKGVECDGYWPNSKIVWTRRA
jgi:hypothetical protein